MAFGKQVSINLFCIMLSVPIPVRKSSPPPFAYPCVPAQDHHVLDAKGGGERGGEGGEEGENEIETRF